eukprot:GEMP01103931.1.p1 GENE.GEMP01103931.1~~GEMP01103931.1.p1  ORF type:complete len:108 (-),score=17.63 GEMP01103931.1:70-393(-)
MAAFASVSVFAPVLGQRTFTDPRFVIRSISWCVRAFMLVFMRMHAFAFRVSAHALFPTFCGGVLCPVLAVVKPAAAPCNRSSTIAKKGSWEFTCRSVLNVDGRWCRL